MTKSNMGQIVATAWEKYIKAAPEDNLFSDSWLKPRLKEPTELDLLAESMREMYARCSAAGGDPGVIITSRDTYSVHAEKLKALGKERQRQLNAELFSDGTFHGLDALAYTIDEKKTVGSRLRAAASRLRNTTKSFDAGLEPLDITRTDVFDEYEYSWKLADMPVVLDKRAPRNNIYFMNTTPRQLGVITGISDPFDSDVVDIRAELMESLKIKVDSQAQP